MNFKDKLCSHYLNADFSNDFLSDRDDSFQVGLPYPIHKPFKNTQIDIVAKYNSDSKIYTQELSKLCKEFKLVKEEIMDQKFNETHAKITKGLLDFCNIEASEIPFPCDYNPYYTTGRLARFHLNNKDYLIRPDSINRLCVTNILKSRKIRKLHVETPLKNITGVFSSPQGSNDLFLWLQHLNEINLLKVEDVKEPAQIIWNKKFKRKVLSLKCNKTKLSVILSNLKQRLYDIETAKRIDVEADNCSAICSEFIDDNSIALLNQKSLKIYDPRSNNHNLFQPELDDCNVFCSFKVNNNLVYVGSRHHLLRSDIRYLKNIEFCTHLLRCSPCYMDLFDNNGIQFLCLSSQKFDEKVLFYGSPISSLPLNVPSVCDSLTECGLQKDILLKGHLNERLFNSITGIKLLGDHNMFLYTVNCLGEIYKQQISKEMENDQSNPIESLYSWINNLPESPKPLRLTHAEDLSKARFALNKHIKEDPLIKFTKSSNKVKRFLTHFGHLYRANNLSDLAANFASIWDDGEEEEEERGDVDLVPEVEPLEKVSSWIESNYFFK